MNLAAARVMIGAFLKRKLTLSIFSQPGASIESTAIHLNVPTVLGF
jgi:hypothetical protein